MKLRARDASAIRAGIHLGRSHWGTDIILEFNLEDGLWGRAYDRTRQKDPLYTKLLVSRYAKARNLGPGFEFKPIERKPLEPHGVDLRIAGYTDRVAEQQQPFRDAAKRMRAELETFANLSPERTQFLKGAIATQERRIAELNLDVVAYATRLNRTDPQ